MSTFELQVYKTGIWNVDSYFDDRDLALSEAEKLDETRRHAGVRILQEDYDEGANISSCRVIFSKMRQSNDADSWRAQAKQAPAARPGGSVRGPVAGKSRARGNRQSTAKKSKSSLYLLLGIGLIVLIAGAAAMIGLQEIAKFL